MKIIVSGGTGFVGKPLTQALLQAGHEVILLTRHPEPFRGAHPKLGALAWDGRKTGAWAETLDGADAVINLAGEPIAGKRWSEGQKKEILESRTAGTHAIVEAIRSARRKPSVLINASAVGIYGDVPDGEVSESHPRGVGFLAETCEAWEQAALEASALGVRVVLLRIGIVLETGGGALAKMTLPFQLFAGGPLGSGRQWFPWVHRDDILGMIFFALENTSVSGPVNAVAPEPVTMSGFCSCLGKALGRPSWAPVPAFMLRLLLGEMAEMLLGGQKVIPQKILEAGYEFQYPCLDGALESILKGKVIS